MKKILQILALFYGVAATAQITPISSHYMLLQETRMPGLWGLNSEIDILANFRGQYTGINGAPLTTNLAFSMPIPYTKNHGIGAALDYDIVGPMSFFEVNLGYNFLIPKDKFTLGFGAAAGIKMAQINGAELITPTGDYSNSTNHNDPLLPTSITKSIVPSIHVGVSFSNKLLTQHIALSDIWTGDIKIMPNISTFNYGMTLQSLTKFNIGLGSNFTIEPSMHIITNFKQFQHTLGAVGMFKNVIGAGILVRGYTKNQFESLIPVIRAKAFKNMTIQYSYDALLNGLNDATNGSHEMSLKYELPKTWNKYYGKAINNPRFL